MPKLTGNYYHKKTIFGLILMVEWEIEVMDNCPYTFNWRTYKKYKKARQEDLVELCQKKQNLLTLQI